MILSLSGSFASFFLHLYLRCVRLPNNEIVVNIQFSVVSFLFGKSFSLFFLRSHVYIYSLGSTTNPSMSEDFGIYVINIRMGFSMM